MKRTSTAVWSGTGKEGKGIINTPSGAVKDASYTWASRFENSAGTNPEELIAAAHAGCFSMKLSFVLGGAGLTPDKIETSCEIVIENGTIMTSHLTVKAKVSGATPEKFKECAEDAKQNCPVSKVLNATITMDASLTD
jgi:osmotically inducible protein OsmC